MVMKKTLEEVAESLFPDSSIQKRIFTKGAKWQADQSQEAINKLISIIEWYDNESDVRPDLETFMWFEQFKKK
jgi:glyceraldehyde-3-phosphate dehydrogenase/erythrose-4-phosphate dehydrogenase